MVFDVAGTIYLEDRLLIEEPYLTVEGPDEPGTAVTVMVGREIRIRDTHDVIFRNLRIRGMGTVENQDVMNVLRSHDIVFDHMSFSWGTDETLSIIEGSHDVTVQWSIIAEGLAPMGKGSLISSGAHRVTLYGNLYVHHAERMPKIYGETEGEGAAPDPRFEMVNNTVYNWEAMGTSVAGGAQVDLVGNVFLLGPDTHMWPRRSDVVLWQRQPGRAVYAESNLGPACFGICQDEWMQGFFSQIDGKRKTVQDPGVRREPFVERTVPVHPTDSVLARVLAGAGAGYFEDGSGSAWRRDPFDESLLDDVRWRRGSLRYRDPFLEATAELRAARDPAVLVYETFMAGR